MRHHLSDLHATCPRRPSLFLPLLAAIGLSLSAHAQSNGVLRELWFNIPGSAVADLTNNAAFPNSPSAEDLLTSGFETTTDVYDTFGQRLRALLIPPVTGNYVFLISSDDNSQLYLSSNATPAGRQLIARVNGWTPSRQYYLGAEQKSAPIALVAGQQYYIEALVKEDGGGDNLAVTWQKPGDALPAAGSSPIPNSYLVPYGLGAPSFITQPANASVMENSTATFSVQLDRPLGTFLQWVRNGTNIPGATNATLLVGPVRLAESGSTFYCRASNLTGTSNSTTATLSVTVDATRPTISYAQNFGDRTLLTVGFSEALDPVSAGSPANYFINNGVAILEATLLDDGTTVLLRTTPLAGDTSYLLTVSNVRDLAQTPNTILPSSQKSFSTSYAPLDASYITGTAEPPGPSSRRTALAISEIMYHPADRADGRNLEFIEIYNSNPWAEDLGGHRLAGDVGYTFPAGTTLGARSYCVIAANPADVQAVYGLANVLGPLTNSSGNLDNVLPNSGATVRLRDELGAVLLEVGYQDDPPWPAAADGAGHSLVLARPSLGEGDARAWSASVQVAGSPGAADPGATHPWRTVLINEVLAHTDPPEEDFIELFNYGSAAVNLENCVLTDDPATNKFRFPLGASIPARGFLAFTSTQLGFALSASGETIYLLSSDGSRVIDSLRYGAQENGVAWGRYPDGAPRFRRLSDVTRGTPNAPRLESAVLINEVMYHPPAGGQGEAEEFVELYNRGTSTVNLQNWRLSGGISYEFPAGVSLAPGAYLVVAQNASALLSAHPNLDSSLVRGNYSGKLANSGDRVVLEASDVIASTNEFGQWVTNTLHIAVDEVVYGTGGRWGVWSDGGGSSLERIHARGDGSFAGNWADSDETAKSGWMTVEFTGVLDLGDKSSPDQLQMFLMGPGECLVDNVEVVPAGGGSALVNGTFDGGTSEWVFQGTHEDSHWQAAGGYSGGCLHLVASDRGDPGANRIRTTLTQSLTPNTTATLRARVKWLKGHQELLLRLRGNWLEASGITLATRDLGSPGARNSRFSTNHTPAITDVRHSPILPVAGQAVTVTAQLDDPEGIALAVLKYRLDPATNYTSVTMTARGAGLYSGTIPGQSTGRRVAFCIEARNGSGLSQFPQEAPIRECLVGFGESSPAGTFGDYRLWVTQANVNRWASREKQSNRGLDATFVYGGSRVCYNVSALYSGSPFHTPGYNSPEGNACDYEVNFPKDDRLLGVDDFLLGTIGNLNSDPSFQAERTAFWIGRQLGVPYLHRRYVRLFFNGQLRSQVYEDCQQPNGEVVSGFYPDDDQGDLYKIEDWFEFDDTGDRMLGNVDATLGNFTTTGGVKKTARYRWNWRPRATGGTPSNFGSLFALVDAVNTAQPEPFRAHVAGLVNVEEFMRVLAMERIVGNWDSYGYSRGKNMFTYKPQQGRWELLPWDIDFVLSSGGNSPTEGLFGSNEPFIDAMRALPEFQRAYWRAFADAVNGPLLSATLSAQLDPRYTALLANGVTPESPSVLKNYAAQRRNYLLAQLAGVASAFTVGSQVTVSNGLGVITGTAPINVSTLAVNGTDWTVRWTTVNNWIATVPLQTGSNFFSVVGVDAAGGTIAGASNGVSFVYNTAVPSPVGSVVINEIMFNPSVAGGEFVELFNTSTTHAFDLSGWDFEGLAYTFPAGTMLNPRSYLLLVRDWQAFSAVHGPTIFVFGQFEGKLQLDGETLSLLKPGTLPGEKIVVDRVRYEPGAPWPATATGDSLQLRDSAQDNSRVANWTSLHGAGPQWKYVSTTGNANGSRLYIYLQSAGDVYIDDLTVVAGSVPDSGPNLLLNGGFESSLTGSWTVTADFATSALSTEVKRSGASSLHLVATAAGSGNGDSVYQNITPGLTVGQPYSMSFWYLPSTNGGPLTLRISGSSPQVTINPAPAAGESIPATPGTANSFTAVLPVFPAVWLNEAQPLNGSGPFDNAGERDPWVELFNPGGTALNLGGYYLSDSYTNLARWAFPSNAVVPAGGFLTVWCDNQTGQAAADALHANFRLAPDSGQIALARILTNGIQLVDYLTYSGVRSNWSYGDFPDAQPFYRQPMFQVTPAATNSSVLPPITVFINEWMADNLSTLMDPADNNYEDWFEIYNPGTNTVDLGGCYLTDNLLNPTQFQVPNNGHYRVPPGGFLLVWADDEDEQNNTNRTDLHASFALSKGGDAIGLFAADGTLIDAVTFGAQQSNVSRGRFPEGSANIFSMPVPTPRAANVIPNSAPILAPLNDVELTLGQVLSFTATAQDTDLPAQALTFRLGPGAPLGASIHPLTGAFQWTPAAVSGPVPIEIIVEDNGVPALSATGSFQVTILAPPTISVQNLNGQLQFSWPRGTLQAADEVTGPYLDVADESPFTALATGARKFYRLRL